MWCSQKKKINKPKKQTRAWNQKKFKIQNKALHYLNYFIVNVEFIIYENVGNKVFTMQYDLLDSIL